MGRLRKSFAANIYLSIAGVAGQLIIVPFFLHFWGTELYGAWLVLFTIPTLFMFADVGLANAVGNEVSLCVEREQFDRAEAVFNSAWKYQALMCFGLFFILIGLVWLFPADRWLGLEHLVASEFRAAVLLLAAGTFLELQKGLLSGIYRGAHRYHHYIAWSAHGSVAEYLAIVGMLVAGGGIIALSGTILVVRFLKVGVLFLGAQRKLPYVRLRPMAGRWRDFRSLLPTAVSYFSFPVANAIINQGTVLVVNYLLGPSSVVLLSVSRQLARLFQRGTALIKSSVHPEMTVALGRNDKNRVIELQAMAVTIVILAAIVFIPAVIVAGPTLIKLWTQKELGVTRLLIAACAFEAVAFGAQGLFGLVPWASNRVFRISLFYIAGNVLALALATLTVSELGLAIFPTTFAFCSAAYCIYALRVGSNMGEFRALDAFNLSVILRYVPWRFRFTFERKQSVTCVDVDRAP